MNTNLANAVVHLEVSERQLCKELESSMNENGSDNNKMLVWAIGELNTMIVELRKL